MTQSSEPNSQQNVPVPFLALNPTLDGWFINPRHHRAVHWVAYDREGLIGRSRSASYFPESGPLRESFEREIRAMFDRHAKDGVVQIAHACETVVAERAA